MHIKQIIIQGFKSYKDQTVIEPFSAGLNVIVGRNGSGKSNFFAAIRFVLSDAYTQISREERQALLHEGSGSAVMSAYVEVIFDNSDERFPTGKPELVLRRTIGLKKDEYSLDRKSSTKTDVMNLLESAGFSRSNPYYIVPQGRVTTLTNMKDAERLVLLKEVAGTQVYEARRTESLKLLNETDNKKSKTDALLDFIEERLAELEEEKEELRQFQEADREHRCLQYTILHREQMEYQNAIDTIEQQRLAGVDETDENRTALQNFDHDVLNLDDHISQAKQHHEFQMLEKKHLDDERKEAQRDKAKVELEVKSLLEGQSAAQKAKVKHDKELQDVQKQIAQREKELSNLMPSFNSVRTSENAIRSELEEAEATRRRLFAKQGRAQEFKSKKERDNYLRKEIDTINVQLASRKAVLMGTDDEIAKIETEITDLDASLTDVKGRIDGRGNDLLELGIETDKVKEGHDQLNDRRRELWREESRQKVAVQSAQSDLEAAENSLQRMTDRNTWQGMKNVRRIQEEQALQGVYGTFGELFEVQSVYQTAVEVTAGQSLFHYVVDTDETASKLISILNKERGGRVTFMPLDKLTPKAVKMPQAADAIPMVSKVEFDPAYEKAFQYVFGRTIITPNLSVASQYARKFGVSAITPAGDRADKKGALTGGWHDTRQSRIDATRREVRCRREFQAQTLKLKAMRTELEKLDQEITRSTGEVQKLEQQRAQLDGSYEPLRRELRSYGMDLQRKRDALAEKKRHRDTIAQKQRQLADDQKACETELASDFQKSLTPAEQTQLEGLGSIIQDLGQKLMAASKSRSDIEARKNELEVELQENLRLRLDNLNAQDVEDAEGRAGVGNSATRLKDRQRALQRVQKILDDLGLKLNELEEAVDAANQQVFALQQQRTEKLQAQEELLRSIERNQKRMEKSLQKKALLTDKLAETTRDIRDLGVLPDDAFEKYEQWDSDKAMKRLHKVKDALKKYSHVNKKAFEQYNTFTKQRDTLKKRRNELDDSFTAIEELIQHLDMRKDDAIERTFKQVSKEFAVVFEKLVPAGKGRLIIQRKSDRQVREEHSGDSEVEHEERRGSVENYTGVGISVSFNSKHDEQQRIQQLSGGQKSLCALALVFAIQRCDPAPFYLFDEIDANLDAQYRTAVAQMLRALSNIEEGGGQFICTTFRPEMVLVAEKCYGVTYTNKTSSIDVVDREAALEFVDGAAVGK